MYFLAEAERQLLQRRLMPQVRRSGIVEELRGWNWDEPPLSPVYETRLAIYEVANQYCETGRDLYLRRCAGLRPRPNPAMEEGRYLHSALSQLFLGAKTLIYRYGVEALPALENDLAAPPAAEFDRPPHLSPAELEETRAKAEALWRFERDRICARVRDACSRHQRLSADAVIALALPVFVDLRLDGTLLGLSSSLAAEAFAISEGIVFDVKFGPKEPFDRLANAGYALVMESVQQTPVNFGCSVYVSFGRQGPHIQRDLYVIDEELRQRFIEARDERARMVETELDPGLPAHCPETCPFLAVCHGDRSPKASGRPGFANLRGKAAERRTPAPK